MPRSTPDPRRFSGQPMMLRPAGDHDYTVTCAGEDVGRIYRSPATGGRTWIAAFWLRPVWEGWQPIPETPESLAEAKALIRREMDRWLAWAIRMPGGRSRLAGCVFQSQR